VFYCGFGRGVLAAVGKTVGRDVNNSHYQRPLIEAEHAIREVPGIAEVRHDIRRLRSWLAVRLADSNGGRQRVVPPSRAEAARNLCARQRWLLDIRVGLPGLFHHGDDLDRQPIHVLLLSRGQRSAQFRNEPAR
jgi:hypothetical protein